MQAKAILNYTADQILDSLNDGVYVTDLNRRIVFWNCGAERITGWRAEEVVGHACHENILCHTDKDGNRLCGKEQCPLHRAMVTGSGSATPILIFAHDRDGRKIPVQVNVSPIRDEQGNVVGGVEIFRDASERMLDLERARTIQSLSMGMPANDDPRIRFAVKYLPRDIIGGDFYTVEKLDPDRYAFGIVDVMGHGTAAGLYAMHLHSLWEANRRILDRPASFVSQLNKSLCQLVRDGESFATGLFGFIDLKARAVALCAAGNPSFFLTRQGQTRRVSLGGLPLGLLRDHIYEMNFMPLEPGDGLLLLTDGATEITGNQNDMLGSSGLAGLIDAQGFPETEENLAELLENLRKFSGSVAFPDDVTMLTIHCTNQPAALRHPELFPEKTAPMPAASLRPPEDGRPETLSSSPLLTGEKILFPKTFSGIDALIEACWEAIESNVSRLGYSSLETKIHLALHETLVNAWRHGNGKQANLPITFRWRFAEGFTFEVLDAGPGFSRENPTGASATDQLTAESGRGLTIIRFCADDLCLKENGSHAIVSFTRP